MCEKQAGLFSESVYFTDYTTRFKQVSRDGESDSVRNDHINIRPTKQKQVDHWTESIYCIMAAQ